MIIVVTLVLVGSSGRAVESPERRPTPPSLRVTGPIANPVAVGPGAEHPLTGIDRDAGISVPLSDGSVLWLFGDTAKPLPGGSLEYFVIGTASWAAPGDPTRTTDAVVAGEPVRFATPTDEFPACPADAPAAGMWPASAVAVPVGTRDRVIVWLENVCLGEGGVGIGRGMSVAVWWYDPSGPPADQPVVAEVLNQRLSPQRWFGLASFLGGDGLIYAYSCDEIDRTDVYGTDSHCYLARVTPEGVATPDAYRVWDGQDWVRDRSTAAPMDMPARDGAAPTPPGSISVANSGSGLYFMAYSPWPALSKEIEVRVARHPWGPWSRPVPVPLPDCSDVVADKDDTCYSANLQTLLSGPGRLGIGWYDRLVDPVNRRGSFKVSSVPIEVVPAGG